MMNVGIIGLGVVGKAVQHGFTRIGHTVIPYDIKFPDTSIRDILKTEIVFVSVPTPHAENSACDTSIIESVIHELSKIEYKGLVVIKSTVEPGTTDRLAKEYPQLRFAFCPEFLREKASYSDFSEQHDVCVIGAYTTQDYELVKKVHDPLPQNYAHVTPLEAEFAKYFLNVFNALRIVFANQFYDVCKVAGADYQKVKNAMTKHRVIPPVYLDCNENFRGFGGTCLPKDTSAFAFYGRKILGADAPSSLFEQIVEINKRYKRTAL